MLQQRRRVSNFRHNVVEVYLKSRSKSLKTLQWRVWCDALWRYRV